MGHGDFMNQCLQEIMRKQVGFLDVHPAQCFATSPHALSEKVFVFGVGMGLKLLAEKM